MRVLFFGLGGVGQRHLRNLIEIEPDVSLGAVKKTSRTFEIDDKLQAHHDVDVLEKYNIEKFSSLDEAEDFKADFAVVTNPTSVHVKTALELVEKNIPVFMEKPVSDNYIGLKELLEASEKKNVPVMIGYMMRFNPCAVKLKELIDKNRIGRVYSVVLIINSYLPSWHKYEKVNEFYAGSKKLGGGVVLTEIHELDLLNWYFGTPGSLWAVGGKLSSLDIDVEDTVSILLEQEYNKEKFPVNINMCFVQKAPLRKLFIQGEKGRIDWDISGSIVTVEDKEKNKQESFDHSDFPRNQMFIDELKHFIKCVKDGKEPDASIHKVINGHLTALGIKESLKEKNIVKKADFLKLERK